MQRDRWRFYGWHVGVPLVLAALLLAAFELTALDRWVSDMFYDAAQQRFPLRKQAFLERVVHRGGKYVVALIALGALVVCALSWWVAAWRSVRRAAGYIFLAIALGTGAVAALKATTNKHCPYDLTVYGGAAPYVRLLDAAPPGAPRGNCFPGGHASGGFALMAFYFVWYRRRPVLARAALVGGFVFGFVLGFGRVMQGAHFVSHNLWAALVCWLVAVLLYRLLLWPPLPRSSPGVRGTRRFVSLPTE